MGENTLCGKAIICGTKKKPQPNKNNNIPPVQNITSKNKINKQMTKQAKKGKIYLGNTEVIEVLVLIYSLYSHKQFYCKNLLTKKISVLPDV